MRLSLSNGFFESVEIDVMDSPFVDLIFKNQAMNTRDKPQGQFVNDLLRTEFHKYVIFLAYPVFWTNRILLCRKFMSKFIKV